MGAPLVIVCPTCGIPFTRHGAARSSNFYKTDEENGTCIVCREGLDPITLERLPAGGAPMEKPARLTDVELLEAIELAAHGPAPNAGVPLLVGLALEAAARIRARGRDELRDRLARLEVRASHLEDAAFHFQTCATCRREGEGACTSGARFAAYLRGEELDSPAPGPMIGKISGVSIGPDGTLTARLKVNDGGRKLFEGIRRASDAD